MATIDIDATTIDSTITTIGGNAAGQLRSIIERIERLEDEKADLAEDIKEVYAEAKGNGYCVKALRTIVRMRKQDDQERAEEESILATYLHALGMDTQTELPLDNAA
jgi:uncharacterized protein (UPF0335 family)